MVNIKDYPLFIPPEEVNSKKPREWSYTAAKVYFDWFMSVKDDRVEYLLTVLEEDLYCDNEKSLKRVGQKVFDILHKVPFSTDESSGKVITNKGLAPSVSRRRLIGTRCSLKTTPLYKNEFEIHGVLILLCYKVNLNG